MLQGPKMWRKSIARDKGEKEKEKEKEKADESQAAARAPREEKVGAGRVDKRAAEKSEGKDARISSGLVTYQIGQEIGRGGFGTVFEALCTDTGDFVAVKRVALHNIDSDSLASIALEIDLLKKLNHVNIVQYIDSIQTENYLHIVLEIMESSLAAMCKKFGNFSESLTAIYMTQVLEGLRYLHEQGVLHRDIKGANILTTKNGLLKLADFGVALKLSDAAGGAGDDMDVVGTPYWMAPEIIEMTGTTAACDVWSVGCTIIELITGKPPYFDLPQISALYKIVQDDHPPLPDGVSSTLLDFLLQCFKKEPAMRKSASELLAHAWLKNPKNHLRKVGGDKHLMEDVTAAGERQAMLKTVRTYAQLMHEKSPQRRYDLSDGDLQDLSDMADGMADQIAGERRPLSPLGQSSVREEEEEEEDWDKEIDDAGMQLPNPRSRRKSSLANISPFSEEAQMQRRAMAGAPKSLSKLAAITPSLPDVRLEADELADWGDDEPSGLAGNQGAAVSGHRAAPTESLSLGRFAEAELDDFDDMEVPDGESGGVLSKILSLGKGRGASLADALKSKIAQQQAKDGSDQDHDPFGKDFEEAEMNVGGVSELKAESDLHERVGREVYEAILNLELGITVEATAAICAKIDTCPEARFYVISADNGAVPILHLIDTAPPESLAAVVSLINKIVDSNAQALEHLALVGLIPKVAVHVSSEVALLRVEVAKFVKALCSTSDFTLQLFVSCGGLSILTDLVRSVGNSKLEEAETDARALVRVGIDGVLNIFSLQRIRRNEFCHIFLSLQLLPGIMETFRIMLQRALVSGVEGSSSALMSPSDGRNSLGSGGTMTTLLDGQWPLRYLERTAQILMTFSKSDRVVKEGMASDDCLSGIMSALSTIYPTYVGLSRFSKLTTMLLTVVKNISMEPSTLGHLQAANAFGTLVPMLKRTGFPCDQDVENQVLQSMFYLCRISRKRQERAAVAGLVPYLQRCILEESHLKQFALQIMCDLAHSTAAAREILWQQNGMDFYLSIIANPRDLHWHTTAFRSISAWMLADTDRVERHLTQQDFLLKIIGLFRSAVQAEFEKVVDELHSMMQRSCVISRALGTHATFVEEVKKRLHYPKAIVTKTLLAMLRLMYKSHSRPRELIRQFNLYPTVSKLARNHAQVLVAEIATQLLHDFDQLGKYGI